MATLFLASNASESLSKFKELKKRMTVALIATAADPYTDKSFVEWDRCKLIELGLTVIDYDIKRKTQSQLLTDLSKVDAIFISGGNTFYLLEKMLESGFDKAIKKLLSSGKIYIGSSAGSVVAGAHLEPIQTIDNPAAAKKLKTFKGLMLVNFIVLPHVDNKKYEPKTKEILTRYADKYKIVPIKDTQAVLVKGKAYRIL